ncbi:MAG TPA: ATP-binding protein [Candidatus Thermoplasmatota archaeon]|jgi:MoxR-like ATPase|nr:ATP-binding protein [Candidatus Thermoplasmatota archaeon]
MPTAQDLVQQRAQPQRPREAMRQAVLERLKDEQAKGASRTEAMQALFAHTVLDDDVLEHVVSTLLAGSNMLVIGPPGSGKTSLAKDIWSLMPKEVWAVEDCPVQDDPLSLVDAKAAEEVPPCPYCKTRYGGVSMKQLGEFDTKGVEASKVPIRKLRLREGHGFARLQGSPEVFPDNLTGAINLAKLEQVGDPNSPLVLEPGKVMQANRGVLLIDEIGKLPRGTQNVLLQALQESIVTPAKSRETFPASFLAVCTSNLEDLDNINEPLNDRLSKLFVGFNENHEKNRAIVDLGLQGQRHALLSEVLRESTVNLIEDWRKTAEGTNELLEVGSNRTMLDVLARTEAYALLRGAQVAEAEDWRRGALDAMAGRIRARGGDSYQQNRDVVERFVDKRWREAGKRAGWDYWCRFSAQVLKDDKHEGRKFVQEAREGLKRGAFAGERTGRFAEFVKLRERAHGADGAAALAVFQLLEAFGTFEAQE